MADKPKKQPHVTHLAGIGDVADWIDWKSREKAEDPEWLKGGREPLKTTVETQRKLNKLPRPVTPKAKEKLKHRLVKEIFGTPECQEWYINKLREAIETMNGDKLYDFIRSHPSYNMSSFVAWNSDFARLIGLKGIPAEYKGASQRMTHMRITAAAQIVMVDYWQNDVFQLTFTKSKINPWIYVDGKMGPYSVSVLNDYWMARHSDTSTKKPIPPGRSALDKKSYPKGGRHAVLYGEAIKWLISQGKPNVTPTGDLDNPYTPPEQELGDKVKERYAGLDKAGESVKIRDLYINDYSVDLGMKLSEALGLAYGEKPNPGDTSRSPKLFRALNLIAQKEGEKIDRMKIEAGDTINLSSDGLFTVKDKGNKSRYHIRLS